MRHLLIVVALLAALGAHADVTVLTINTDFLWDHRLPHEGAIVGRSRPAPTEDQYAQRLAEFRDLITNAEANVVALQEIEGCHIAADLVDTLNQGKDKRWRTVCKEGRDTYTGQDVAVLTIWDVVPGTVSTFPDFSHRIGGRNVRPSKVVGAILAKDGGEETVLVIAAHLISQRSDNDDQRLGQAKAIASSRLAMESRYRPTHTVIIGDMNDVPGSPTLRALKSGNGNAEDLINPATAKVCSYVYRKQCNLIDHVLVSPGLAGGQLRHIAVPRTVSDHHAVVFSTK